MRLSRRQEMGILACRVFPHLREYCHKALYHSFIFSLKCLLRTYCENASRRQCVTLPSWEKNMSICLWSGSCRSSFSSMEHTVRAAVTMAWHTFLLARTEFLYEMLFPVKIYPGDRSSRNVQCHSNQLWQRESLGIGLCIQPRAAG